MGVRLQRFLLLLVWVLLPFGGNAMASNTSLSVWLDNQVYTLELEPHTPSGLSVDSAADHFKGTVAGIDDSWARVSRIDNAWEGVVSIGGELFLFDLKTPKLSTRSLQSSVITATPAAAFDAIGACALQEKSSGSSSKSPLSTRALQLSTPTAQSASFNTLCDSTVDGVCLMAEMDFVFDQDFQNDFPASYQSRATQLINIIEGYYRNDLDIAFKTLSMTFLSTTVFSSTTDSLLLLKDISEKKQAGKLDFSSKNEALLQVITGRDFQDDTVGIAWLEGLCDTSGYWSTSTAQVVVNNIAITALVAAHEVGHNLGAGHDGDGNNCGSGFIMEPSLNLTANQFSTCSVAYIQNAIGRANNQNACFDYPFDIEIQDNNSGTAITTSNTRRGFIIQSAAASQAINQASIAGRIASGTANFTGVTLDDTPCNIASDGQAYTCTLNTPNQNHLLYTDLTVSEGNLVATHSVSVSQSQLTETDTTNNSITDSLTVTLNGENGVLQQPEDNVQPASPPSVDTNSGTDTTDTSQSSSGEADSGSNSSSGGGGGAPGPAFILACLALLAYRRWRRA